MLVIPYLEYTQTLLPNDQKLAVTKETRWGKHVKLGGEVVYEFAFNTGRWVWPTADKLTEEQRSTGLAYALSSN